ncbi:site-2 protease family protein [Viridibacterium curvum]|uniref:Peptidase M50 domain-containing protein n=1 Tax=Viridibacterium curvum TaxID=1101404 RepID=A0ABP9QU65_9RHOO
MIKLLLLLLNGAKLGKLLTTGGSMLVSVVLYAWIFGWGYAVGFVAMMFLHEMGHFIAARQRGLPAGLPTFIPFIGAWTQLERMPHDAETEAYVGIAGPLAGTLAALICYFFARDQHSPLLLAVAYSGFFLNLLNLLPVPLFDGGRITAAISRRIWFVGVPVLIALLLWRPSPALFIMTLLAAPQLWDAWKTRHEIQHYFEVPLAKRLEYGALYIALIGYLAVMTSEVHDMLSTVRVGGFPT